MAAEKSKKNVTRPFSTWKAQPLIPTMLDSLTERIQLDERILKNVAMAVTAHRIRRRPVDANSLHLMEFSRYLEKSIPSYLTRISDLLPQVFGNHGTILASQPAGSADGSSQEDQEDSPMQAPSDFHGAESCSTCSDNDDTRTIQNWRKRSRSEDDSTETSLMDRKRMKEAEEASSPDDADAPPEAVGDSDSIPAVPTAPSGHGIQERFGHILENIHEKIGASRVCLGMAALSRRERQALPPGVKRHWQQIGHSFLEETVGRHDLLTDGFKIRWEFGDVQFRAVCRIGTRRSDQVILQKTAGICDESIEAVGEALASAISWLNEISSSAPIPRPIDLRPVTTRLGAPGAEGNVHKTLVVSDFGISMGKVGEDVLREAQMHRIRKKSRWKAALRWVPVNRRMIWKAEIRLGDGPRRSYEKAYVTPQGNMEARSAVTEWLQQGCDEHKVIFYSYNGPLPLPCHSIDLPNTTVTPDQFETERVAVTPPERNLDETSEVNERFNQKVRREVIDATNILRTAMGIEALRSGVSLKEFTRQCDFLKGVKMSADGFVPPPLLKLSNLLESRLKEVDSRPFPQSRAMMLRSCKFRRELVTIIEEILE